MDFPEVLDLVRRISLYAAVGVALYAIISLRPRYLGLILGVSVILMISYPAEPLLIEGDLRPWFRHASVYVGMIGLAVFLQLFARSAVRSKTARIQNAATMLVGVAVTPEVAGDMGYGTLTGFLGLLSDQGLHHIAVMPLFVAVLIATIVRSADAPAALRKPLKLFLLAGTAIALSHLAEFIIKSQDLVPILDGVPMDTIETALAYTMLFLTFLGIRSNRAAISAVV